MKIPSAILALSILPTILLANMDERIHQIFSNELIVLLAEDLDPESHSIRLQDYIVNGKSFLPAFTSKQHAIEAFGGRNPDRPMLGIKGAFFASILNGAETIKINPSLEDELIIHASEILRVMKDEIDEVRAELSDRKDQMPNKCQ